MQRRGQNANLKNRARGANIARRSGAAALMRKNRRSARPTPRALKSAK